MTLKDAIDVAKGLDTYELSPLAALQAINAELHDVDHNWITGVEARNILAFDVYKTEILQHLHGTLGDAQLISMVEATLTFHELFSVVSNAGNPGAGRLRLCYLEEMRHYV
jgi:hypothetical protein